MRVLVCGSRHFYDWRLLEKVLDEANITYLIHGGAAGTDSLAQQWALYNNTPYRSYPAYWDTYGKRAGIIRNKQMVEDGNPESIIAFLAPNSKGTANSIQLANTTNIPVKVINI